MSVHKYFLPPAQEGGKPRPRWRVNYDLPPHPDGRRRRGTKQGFTTRSAAVEWEDDLRGEIRQGIVPSTRKDRLTVAQYLRSWYAGVAGKATWRAHCRDMSEWYLIPHLGGYPLARMDELDAPDLIDQMYRILEEGGWTRTTARRTKVVGTLSPKTVRLAHGVLHAALATAVERKRLHRNPASLAHPPKTKTTKSRKAEQVWTEQQLAGWIDYLSGDRLYGVWYTIMTTGVRRGEMAGLQWSYVDLDDRVLRVRWELTVVDNVPVWVDGAKSEKGERTIDLDAGTIAALKHHRAVQAQERLLCGADYQDSGLVCCWPDGTVMHPDRLLRALYRHAKALEFPRIDVHGLRHSLATIARANGEDPKLMAERFGHDVSVHLSTYGHVRREAHQEAAERIAKRITG